jgi:hypothetical protein
MNAFATRLAMDSAEPSRTYLTAPPAEQSPTVPGRSRFRWWRNTARSASDVRTIHK